MLTKNNSEIPKRTRRFKFLIFGGFLMSVFLSGHLALAQLGVEYGAATGLSAADPRLIAAQIIRVALGLIGVILVGIIVYGGFVWMTSLGNEEKISSGKKIIINAVIGLMIVLSALAITQFIISRLNEAILGVNPAGGPGASGYSPLSQALGGGIIADHYPARDQKDVPRNTRIMVTFKEPILPKSLIKNYNDNNTPLNLADDTVVKNNNGTPSDPSDDFMELNEAALQIVSFLSGGTISPPLPGSGVKVNFTPDLLTYVFTPVNPLGSPTANVTYEARFAGGTNSIKKSDGSSAFSGSLSQGYSWSFEVSNMLDITPPQIESIVPDPTGGCLDKTGGVCPRNTTVQINFNEPMDPIVTSGPSPGFTNISLSQDGATIAGTYVLTNGYRTVVFTPSLECGLNSCGGKVYCFPASDSLISGVIRAATVSVAPPQASLPYPYDGVTDMVGNSLDGNKNTKADGPTVDMVSFGFKANGAMDITPPKVLSVTPNPEVGSVAPDAPLEMTFSKVLDPITVSSANIRLYGALAADKFAPKSELVPWYVLRMENIYYPSGIKVGSAPRLSGDIEVTKAIAAHGRFLETTNYYPETMEGITDMYQNCLYPAQAPSCAADLSNPYCCNTSKCANGCVISPNTGAPICKP